MSCALNNDNSGVISPRIIFTGFYRQIIRITLLNNSFSEKARMIFMRYNSICENQEFIEFCKNIQDDDNLYSSLFDDPYKCDTEEKLRECFSQYRFLISLF